MSPSGAVKVNNGEAETDYLEAVSQMCPLLRNLLLLLVPLAAPLLAFAGYLVHLCLRSVALLAHGSHLLPPGSRCLLGCVVGVRDALQQDGMLECAAVAAIKIWSVPARRTSVMPCRQDGMLECAAVAAIKSIIGASAMGISDGLQAQEVVARTRGSWLQGTRCPLSLQVAEPQLQRQPCE